jgi:hypothetical protein
MRTAPGKPAHLSHFLLQLTKGVTAMMMKVWVAEAAAATPHTGEMLTYLRGILADPYHPGIRRCARKLIEKIEDDARKRLRV